MAYLGASNGSCYIHLRTGDLITMGEIAREMIAYGQGNSNKRVLFYGTWLLGTALCQSGSWTKAIDVFEDSRRVSPDPWLLVFPTMWIGICQLYNDEFGEGKRHIEEAHDAFLRAGADQLTLVCEMMLGTIAVTEGRIQEGIRSIERINAFWLENEGLALYALGEHLLGKIYLRMAEMRTPLPPLAVLGNLFFLIRTLPRAWRKAESHLQRVIGISEERKALNLLAQASLDLGILYRMRRRNADARRLIERSIELFEQGGATGFLDLARKTLATIPT